MTKLLFQTMYPNHIKALALCTSHDKNRQSLCSIYVELTEGGFSMVATDGHVLAKKAYRTDEWQLLRRSIQLEYGADIPAEPTAGFITPHKSVRHEGFRPFFITEKDPDHSSLFPYPNYRGVIPETFENDKAKMPTFAFNTLARAQKILALFGHKREYFYPTGWNSPIGAAVWRDGDFMLLIMPVRVYQD